MAVGRGMTAAQPSVVHISADGVAVVALVQDREGGGLRVAAQKRSGLIEVGHICPDQDEAQWVSKVLQAISILVERLEGDGAIACAV